ncbi:Ldh family oxidoreductase, partial [Pectobacterium atrosepticum]
MQISVNRLMATVQVVLQKAGCEKSEARIVTEHLVTANLKGHDSHGVGMLPHYVAFIGKG